MTGIGSLLAMVSNPSFGKLSDRTTSRLGVRRPCVPGRPAIAPAILAGGGYGLLYATAGGCAISAAAAILPVKRVR